MPHIIKYDRHEILEYIITYKKEHDGNSPTFRNIMEACKIPSSSHMQYILRELQERGLIRLGGQANVRTIEVVGGQWTYKSA